MNCDRGCLENRKPIDYVRICFTAMPSSSFCRKRGRYRLEGTKIGSDACANSGHDTKNCSSSGGICRCT